MSIQVAIWRYSLNCDFYLRANTVLRIGVNVTGAFLHSSDLAFTADLGDADVAGFPGYLPVCFDL